MNSGFVSFFLAVHQFTEFSVVQFSIWNYNFDVCVFVDIIIIIIIIIIITSRRVKLGKSCINLISTEFVTKSLEFLQNIFLRNLQELYKCSSL